ncbi:MAG: GNAT family N-acetyltransferase [Pseudomonadota bacterium]
MIIRLETERLILRKPVPADYPAWEAFVCDNRSRFVRGDPTVGVAWRTFSTIIGHWEMRGWGLFAITVKGDDQAIGSVGPWYPGNWPEKELGWTLWDSADEGHGYVTEAATETRRHVYEDLGWTTAVSYIAHGNDRSVAVAKRIGCVLDEAAATPDNDPCFVFRHPAPEAAT